MKKRKYQEGSFIGVGISLGLVMGLALSTAIGNFAFMGAGLAIGVAIGAAMEQNAKKRGQIYGLTKKEKLRQKKIAWTLLILGMIILAFVILGMILN